MFLCKLQLDPNHADARRDLADPYEMHSSLVRAVTENPSSDPPRFLWRLEKMGQNAAVVLVQSPVMPRWSRLAGVLDHAEKEFEPSSLVRCGQVCRFRLRANPTVSKNGKRIGLGAEKDQFAWLTRQGERGGFAIRQCVRTESVLLRTGQRKAGGNRITILSAGFEGVLQITDPSLCASILSNGIGHAKAFGLGLLSLARA